MKPQQKLGLFLTLFSLAIIAGATLVPTPDQAQQAADTNIYCLVCGELGVVDVTLNLLLFLPLGIGLALLGLSPLRAVVLVGLTTLTVEILQLALIAGRDASLSDLLTNSAGGVLGFWLGPRLRTLLFPSPRTGFWLATLGMGLWMSQQAFAGWALQREFPPSVYYGQWAPALAQFDQFTGEVLSVRLNDFRLGNGRFHDSDRVKGALEQPALTFLVEATSGAITERTAPVFSIYDDHQRQIALVGVQGHDVVFHLRTRLDRLKLRSPTFLLPGAVPLQAGEPLTIEAGFDSTKYTLASHGRTGTMALTTPVSVSWAWSFVLPFGYDFGPGAPWLTGAWLFGFWLPLGYWAKRADRERTAMWWGLILLTLLLGLGGVPTIFGFQWSPPSEWIAAAAGALAGWLLARPSHE
jgi:hypothetical protein